jgi:small Trp-rich protein
MWVLWIAVGLTVLKLLGIEPLVGLSWWWIIGLFGVAFVWFDLIEERLGLGKKKAFDDIDKAKKDRIKKGLERDKGYRVRR